MPVVTIADVRTYMGAGSAIPDATLTSALAAANATITPLLAASQDMTVDGVREFVLAVTAQVVRNRNSGGTVTDYGDMVAAAGSAVNSSLLRRYYVLAMPYMRVSGWVG